MKRAGLVLGVAAACVVALSGQSATDASQVRAPGGAAVAASYDVWASVSAAWGDNSLADAQTCGVRVDGTLWCWGVNNEGQLGLGDTLTRYRPVQVGGDADWTQVSAGDGTTCAIASAATLWCWGEGYASVPTQVGDATTWRSIAVGDGYRCGTQTDGSLWCWGANTIGQLGLGDQRDRADPTQVPGAWTTVDAGGATTCGIQPPGDLYCWGYNGDGEMGTGGSPTFGLSPTRVGAATDWTQVVDGWNYTCGIRASSTLWCWGNNDEGQLGTGDYGGGSYKFVPTRVGKARDWASVSAGIYHTCGTRAGGTLWCWGTNGEGELGLGQPPYREAIPTRVGALDRWGQVSAGGLDTCSTQTDHTLWCWGDAGSGELGVGSRTKDTTVPVQVGPPNGHLPVSYSFASVSADSPSDVWAVGERQRKSVVTTYVEHGDGSTWTSVPSPSPGRRLSTLSAVTALSPTDAWAVGYFTTGGANHTLVEHWDGTSWTVVDSPNSARKNSELTAVDALSPTNVWAVGQGDDGYVDYPSTLVEHWDGSSWTVVPAAPNHTWAMQTFTGVKVISKQNAWATGYGLVDEEAGYLPLSEHWNGSEWRVVRVSHGDRFDNYFQRAIDATSKNDVWVVGDQELSYEHETTRIEHWTGGPWKTVDAPSPGAGRGTYVNGVSAVTASDVWAVGSFFNGTSMRALYLAWDGSTWTQVQGPSPGGRADTTLTSVSGDAPDDAWAVGFFDNGVRRQPVVLHWDGTAWTVAQKGVG